MSMKNSAHNFSGFFILEATPFMFSNHFWDAGVFVLLVLIPCAATKKASAKFVSTLTHIMVMG